MIKRPFKSGKTQDAFRINCSSYFLKRGMNEHPCPEVNAALVRLCDALCMWERGTSMTSVLILAWPEGQFRAMDGKPSVPADVSNERLLATLG